MAPKGKAKAKVKAKPESKKRAAAESAAAASSSPAKRARGGGGGKKVVDSKVPGREKFSVHEDYSIKLNQTHVDANNNKYYIIQVLDDHGKFYAWNRWGRVGEDGQNKLLPCGSAALAINEFKKKFREKTQNPWENKDNFKPVDGKYSIVETEDAEGGGQDSAPMGKLTKAQIGKGQQVLDKLDTEINKKSPSKVTLDKLSSDFYTLIPTNFGRSRPVPIVNDTLLQAKVELLKFLLRMGFEEVAADKGATPIDGIMDLPLPKTLKDCGVGGKEVDKCHKSAEKLVAKKAGKPKGEMTAHMYAAILLYTSNAIYADLNKCLRDQDRSKIKKYFKYLRLLFEAMNTLPKQKRTLWRGLSVDVSGTPDYKVGNTVTWWSVSSTTADVNVAKNFAKGCGGKCTVFTIESQTATDISDITFFGNEKESLLAPGTQLKVKKSGKSGNVAEITLTEVGREIS